MDFGCEMCEWEDIEALPSPGRVQHIGAGRVTKRKPTVYVYPDGELRIVGINDAYKRYRIERAYYEGDRLPANVNVIYVQSLPALPSTACLRCPLTRDACATCQFNHKITA